MKSIKFRYIVIFMSEVPKRDIFSNRKWFEKIQSIHVGKYIETWQSIYADVSLKNQGMYLMYLLGVKHLIDIKQSCPQEKPLTEKVSYVLYCGRLILNWKADKGNLLPVLGRMYHI